MVINVKGVVDVTFCGNIRVTNVFFQKDNRQLLKPHMDLNVTYDVSVVVIYRRS